MTVSKRTRFEIFKRDDFTCRYCGRKSPEVVLEVDHIRPRSSGGSDDEMNLATSCFDCNRGKADTPLGVIMTGEDPHDKAIEMLEKERQLAEYNEVLRQVREREDHYLDMLAYLWFGQESNLTWGTQTGGALRRYLKVFPLEAIQEAISIVDSRRDKHPPSDDAFRYGVVAAPMGLTALAGL